MERNGGPHRADPLATEIAALEAGLAATRVLVAALRLRLALKANFDPNQPRVPRGQGRESGRWTDGPGGVIPPAVEPPRNPARPRLRPPRTERPEITVTLPSVKPPGEPVPPSAPLEPPPPVPRERPADARVRNRIIMSVAKWAARAAARSALGPIGHVLTVIEMASWLAEAYPYLRAYFDGPNSLAELQAGVANPRRGYDVHHIVERAPALADGFPVELVDGPDNGLSPREYLRGKNWVDRMRVGRRALVIAGVMNP